MFLVHSFSCCAIAGKEKIWLKQAQNIAGGVVVKGRASLDKRGLESEWNRVERKLAFGPIAFSTGSIRCL